MGIRATPPEERFWKYVIVKDGCWDWSGSKDKLGYCRISRVVNGRRAPMLAHRLSMQIHGVELTDDVCVMHVCDNPSCCNPEHLRVGTKADNNADMRIKKRSARGDRNGKAKLTNAEAIAIKAALVAGAKVNDLARRFNISPSTVSSIKYGTRWIYLAELAA